MGAIYDDLKGHEGHALRRLPDGTLTSAWTAETSAFSSYVAACECRWTGGDHPANEEGYEGCRRRVGASPCTSPARAGSAGRSQGQDP